MRSLMGFILTFWVVFSIQAQTETSNHFRLKPQLYAGLGTGLHTFLPVNETSVYVGVAFHERLFLHGSLSMSFLMKGEHKPQPFHYQSGYFNAKIRILPPRFKVSPIVLFSAGESFAYNQRPDSAYSLGAGIYNYRVDYSQDFGIFYAAGLFYKMQNCYRLMVGIDWSFRQFRIEIAGGPNWTTIVTKYPNYNSHYSYGMTFSSSLNVTYLFDFTKD